MRSTTGNLVRSNRTVASLLTTLLGGLSAILVGLVLGVRGGNLATLSLCVATGIVAFIPILINRGKSLAKRDILVSLFCLAYVGRYVIPPIILYVPESSPIDAPGMYLSLLRPWDVAEGQFVVLLALVAFLIGHTVPLARSLGNGLPTSSYEWTRGATILAGVGLVIFGWLVSAASTFGFLSAALGSGIISTLGSSMLYGNILLTLAYIRFRFRSALILLSIMIALTSLVGFLSGSKTSTLLPPAFAALTYIFEKRRIPLTFVSVGALALAIIYPASEYVRAYVLRDGTRSVAEVLLDPARATSEVGEYVGGQDAAEYLSEGFSAVAARLDSTGVVSVIVRDTPRLSPYKYGETLVLFFIAFVPRAFWPEKPNIAIGQFITDVYGSGPQVESSTGPSQIGDYYLNFSYGGVIAGMLFLGLAFRFAYDLLLDGRSQPSAPALLAAIAIVFSVVITFETNVALAQARVFFILLPIAALHFLIRVVGGARLVELRGRVEPSRGIG